MSILEDDALVRDLFEELRQIGTVDAHEHLPTEREHLDTELDFYSLFEHYCEGDLVAAGAGDDLPPSLPTASSRWLSSRRTATRAATRRSTRVPTRSGSCALMKPKETK